MLVRINVLSNVTQPRRYATRPLVIPHTDAFLFLLQVLVSGQVRSGMLVYFSLCTSMNGMSGQGKVPMSSDGFKLNNVQFQKSLTIPSYRLGL